MTTKLFAIIVLVSLSLGSSSFVSAQDATVITKETLQIEAKAAAEVAKMKAETAKRIAKLEADIQLLDAQTRLEAARKSLRTIQSESTSTTIEVVDGKTKSKTTSSASSMTKDAGKHEEIMANIGVKLEKAKNPGCGFFGCMVYTNGYGGGNVMAYSQPNVGAGGYVQAYRQP